LSILAWLDGWLPAAACFDSVQFTRDWFAPACQYDCVLAPAGTRYGL
jgi:hypothetical protein